MPYNASKRKAALLDKAQKLIAVSVARREQGVTDAGGSVPDKGQDRPSPVGDHAIADLRHNLAQRRPRMLHRHELRKVGTSERPRIDHLLPMSVDDSDALALVEKGGFSFSCGYSYERLSSHIIQTKGLSHAKA